MRADETIRLLMVQKGAFPLDALVQVLREVDLPLDIEGQLSPDDFSGLIGKRGRCIAVLPLLPPADPSSGTWQEQIASLKAHSTELHVLAAIPTPSEQDQADALRAGALDVIALSGLNAALLRATLIRMIGRIDAEQALRNRLSVDKLITNMAMQFINLPPERIGEQIRTALATLGEATAADRSFIFTKSTTGQIFQEYEWCRDGVQGFIHTSSPDLFHGLEWVEEELQRKGALALNDLEQLPASAAALRALLSSREAQSLVLVPLLFRGALLGAVGFSCLSPGREWGPNLVRLLKIAGEIFANALEQQRVQLALQDSELRYRSVVDALGEGIIYSDPDDVILHVNSRFCDLTGYSLNEMLGKRAYELLLPQGEWHKLQERTRKRLQGISEQYDILLTKRDGSQFWARINATPVRDSSGRIVATLGAITDISERKQAIEALRASEKKYRDLVETSSDLIWSVDREGRVTFVNSACRSMYGYEREEMLGHVFWDFVDAPIASKDRAFFDAILHGQQIFQAETRHRRKNGGPISLSINAIPMRGDNGEIIGATGTASDISERKQVEEELRAQREFLRQVIDAVPSYIFVKDSNLRFSLVNEAFAKAYGKRPEDILGKTDHDVHPNPKDADSFVAECREVLSTMKPKVVLELPITNPLTKATQWHYAIRTPLILPDGSPPQVLTVATDITERKRAEDEAIRLEKQLLQAQKMEAIGQLAAGVAHDLNNALGAVVGHLQLLQLSQDLSPPIRNSIEIALSGCERALSLIEQLLGFSRQGRYNLQVVSLRDTLSETLSFLSKVIDKGIEIRLVNASEEHRVRADAAQIQQAITNLIINAKQAMPRGGTLTLAFDSVLVEHPEARNAMAVKGRYAVLRVSDTGSGIDPSIIDKIFEPFFTTKGSDHKDRQGTGLGLAMVYGIMQNHGGWVEVQSTLGRGSCFSLFFPVSEGDVVMSEDAASGSIPKALTGSQGLVLVIDDEPILVDLTRKFLEMTGIQSVGFTSAEEAVEWYRTNHGGVHMIVLDMKMAKMDGPVCFDVLRAINPKARVAILSGYVQDAAAQDLLAKGALRFFQKPLKYPELVQWIASEITHP